MAWIIWWEGGGRDGGVMLVMNKNLSTPFNCAMHKWISLCLVWIIWWKRGGGGGWGDGVGVGHKQKTFQHLSACVSGFLLFLYG